MEFAEEKINPQARFVWHPISSQVRQDIAMTVYTTESHLQGTHFLQVGPLTELNGSIFGVKPNTIRPYEFNDNIHTTVSFEFELDH